MNRKVKYLLPATEINMGGILVKQALPEHKVGQVDPFLLLHHGKFTFTDKAPAKHQGLGPHPHRGFSPVSFVIDGEVHHRDSWGNNQIAKKGEVQWMHAGAGIIHSERPSQSLSERNGTQEVVQLWINTPRKKKMQPPTYQYIPEVDLPTFYSDDRLISNKLIAGKHKNLHGKIKTESDLLVLLTQAKPDGIQTIELPSDYNAMLYVIKGTIRIIGYGKVEKENLIVFDNDGDHIEMSATSNTEFIVLAGRPIGEKIVQQGPFVMNSETEIMEAMRDYQMGKMGVLIEE